MLFYHSFAFKNLNESATTKGLRQCHDDPCIVDDGRSTFPYFLLMGAIQKKSGVCGFRNVKAYEFLIQIFIHGPHQGRKYSPHQFDGYSFVAMAVFTKALVALVPGHRTDI